MTVDMNFKDALNGIVEDVLKMDKILERDQEKALEQFLISIPRKIKTVITFQKT